MSCGFSISSIYLPLFGWRLSASLASCRRRAPGCAQHPPRRFMRLLGRHTQQRFFTSAADSDFPCRVPGGFTLRQLYRLIHLSLRSPSMFSRVSCMLRLTCSDLRVKRTFHPAFAKKGVQSAQKCDGTGPHPMGRSACYMNRLADGIPLVVPSGRRRRDRFAIHQG